MLFKLRSFWKYILPKMPAPANPPVVVVLGATGAGKSQLAIEIASKFNGEIINADAMQLYKGLDVITNKVTEEEMSGVKHHLMDFVDPLESFTIVDFRNRALRVIDKLLEAKKIPVIVGGTNYYIESLLWETLVDADFHKDSEELVSKIQFAFDPNESSASLHARLKQVDPVRAEQIHPNDRRKIERSLDIYENKKRTHSEFLKDQMNNNGSSLGGPLRFKNSLMLKIDCPQDVLDIRLDSRVDKMLARGLIEEMLDFHSSYNAKRAEPDYTLGIFQSIGFKEFHEYLVASEEFRNSKAGKKLFERSVTLMKQRTKRYSRYQEKWVKKRFLGVSDREVPFIFGLDGSDVSKWNENVRNIAYEIMEDFLSGKEGIHKPLVKQITNRKPAKHYTCECGTISMDEISFKAHLTSKKHYNKMKALQKQLAAEEGEGEERDSKKQKKDTENEKVPKTESPDEPETQSHGISGSKKSSNNEVPSRVESVGQN